MSKSKWYFILQHTDTGFFVKKAQFFNVAYVLDHLKFPENQRVIFLGQFYLEKILETESSWINPFINVSLEKEFLALIPALFSGELETILVMILWSSPMLLH